MPPSEVNWLQTYSFMPCDPGTHGPPDSLQPGEPALPAFKPSWSANRIADLKASFHSGDMYAKRFSTTCGVARAASKLWNPPRTDPLHPFNIKLDALLGDVAVHPVPHTCGRAPKGRFRNPLSSGSADYCVLAIPRQMTTMRTNNNAHRLRSLISPLIRR